MPDLLRFQPLIHNPHQLKKYFHFIDIELLPNLYVYFTDRRTPEHEDRYSQATRVADVLSTNLDRAVGRPDVLGPVIAPPLGAVIIFQLRVLC